MPLPARKNEKATTPQDQAAEISTLHLLAQHWFNVLTSRARVAYDTGTSKWAQKMGDRTIPYHLLNDEKHIDQLTEEIHAAHVEHLKEVLKQQTGKPYAKLDDDTVQKYLGWALFHETRDTIRQGIGASEGNYSIDQHEANLKEHIKRQRGRLYLLATQEVIQDEKQAAALLKYLNLNPSLPSHLQRQAIYQKVVENLKTTARGTEPTSGEELEARLGNYADADFEEAEPNTQSYDLSYEEG